MGMGSAVVAIMGNMSMTPLNTPLSQILRIGCDVKVDVIEKNFALELVNKYFSGK